MRRICGSSMVAASLFGLAACSSGSANQAPTSVGSSTAGSMQRPAGTLASSIYFSSDSSDPDTSARALLDSIATALDSTYAGRPIFVAGHASAEGAAAYNQSLSEARARAVTDYLLDKGIAPSRLTHAGFGERFPADTSSATSPLNRRVEILVQ